MSEIKQRLMTDNQLSLATQREKWQTEQEQDVKRRIEAEVGKQYFNGTHCIMLTINISNANLLMILLIQHWDV